MASANPAASVHFLASAVEAAGRNLSSSSHSVLSQAAADSERLQLGLAAGSGFLFVCVCAGLVKIVTVMRQERREDTTKVDGRTADQNIQDEQERATILAEVYGRPQEEGNDIDGRQEITNIGDEAALERAWKAIERDASSDEDLPEVGLYPVDDGGADDDFQSLVRARPASASPAQTFASPAAAASAEMFDIGSPTGGAAASPLSDFLDGRGPAAGSVNGSANGRPHVQDENLLGI